MSLAVSHMCSTPSEKGIEHSIRQKMFCLCSSNLNCP